MRGTLWLAVTALLCHGGTSDPDSTSNRSNDSRHESFQNSLLESADEIAEPHSTSLPDNSSRPHGHLMFVDQLLEDYDKRAWPTYGTDIPTIVTVNMYVISLGAVSAANMDFGMDMYLRQSWIDPRLQFSKFGINHTVTLNAQDIIDKIWKPDLFFRNLKSGHFHSITVPNKLIKLSPNGRILFSMRLTVRLSCHMSFRLYPLDTQKCWVVMGSYAQTTDQVIMKWQKENPLIIEQDIEVPEFHVTQQRPGEFMRDIDTGAFSFVNVSFVFTRQNGYHLVQTYLPTFLIVMMTWVSFWVPVDAAPARVTLGVTTLLSLTTVAAGVRSQLPPVSYAKAVDLWIGACSVMVFAALLEFALASYLSRMKIKHHDAAPGCHIFGKKKGVLDVEAGNPSPESDKRIQLRRSHAVDRFSRVAFPFLFIVFNLFYWTYYLAKRSQIESMYM